MNNENAMTITWHVVQKDLRRLRWWLVAWAGMLALPILIGLRIAMGDRMREEDWNALQKTIDFLNMVEGGMAYLLIILLVAEDGPVGSNRFWLTRPANGRKVGAAKLISGILIIFVVPFLVTLPWWLWSGFGVSDVVKAAMELAALGVLIAVPAALAASLTDSIPRALLWSLVLAAVGISLFPMFVLTVARSAEETAMGTMRMIAAVTICWGFAALAVGSQYLWRNRLRTARLALGVVGAFLLVQLSMTAWPEFWLGPNELREKDAAKADGVTVQIYRSRRYAGLGSGAGVEHRDPDAAPRRDPVDVSFTARGVPDGLKLEGDNGIQKWTWGNLELDRTNYLWANGPMDLFGLQPGKVDPETDQWLRNRWRSEHPNNPDAYPEVKLPENWRLMVRVQAPRSIAQRMTVDAPRFEAKLWMQLVRPTVDYEMPVRPGVRRAGGGFSTRLAGIDRVATATVGKWPAIWLIETRPFLFSDLLRQGLNRFYSYHVGWTERRYALLNRRQGEVFDLGYALVEPGITVSGVLLSWRGMSIRGMGTGFAIVRNGKWVERPGWLDEATLALVAKEPEALFSRDLRIERLAVEDVGQQAGGWIP